MFAPYGNTHSCSKNSSQLSNEIFEPKCYGLNMIKLTNTSPLTFSDLTHARRIAAQLVETLGDEYWPAFDCLDRLCALL